MRGRWGSVEGQEHRPFLGMARGAGSQDQKTQEGPEDVYHDSGRIQLMS